MVNMVNIYVVLNCLKYFTIMYGFFVKNCNCANYDFSSNKRSMVLKLPIIFNIT